MIALGILYRPVYLSLDLHLFPEKYFEYSKDTLICIDNIRSISQQISSDQDSNTQDNRAFQELSEYIITFLKTELP